MHAFQSRLRFVFLWAVVSALTLFALYPSLNGEFYFDDVPNIVENSSIHLDTLNLDTLKASLQGPGAGPLGRPVSVR